MEHLNYCRQMAIDMSVCFNLPKTEDKKIDEAIERMQHCITLAHNSKKFILPPDGHLIGDDEFRALNENEPLRLPFEYIALEYMAIDNEQENGLRSSKRIVFASEAEKGIVFRSVAYIDEKKGWNPYSAFFIPKTQYLDRSQIIKGHHPIRVQSVLSPKGFESKQSEIDDINYEIRVLLGFLNALACSNVHIEKSQPKKHGKKVKSALQFDTYHVLTIDIPGRAGERGGPTGPHRAPREHLRRGHIRRLADGRRIWVNATVVAAGRCAGVVKKDYALRLAA